MNCAFVAVTEEENSRRIVGTASLKFQPLEVFKNKAELGLTVHDDYQNIGIGTALLSHLLGIAKKKQLSKVFLMVNATNKRGLHLYQKAGFEVEGLSSKRDVLEGKIPRLI